MTKKDSDIKYKELGKFLVANKEFFGVAAKFLHLHNLTAEIIVRPSEAKRVGIRFEAKEINWEEFSKGAKILDLEKLGQSKKAEAV